MKLINLLEEFEAIPGKNNNENDKVFFMELNGERSPFSIHLNKDDKFSNKVSFSILNDYLTLGSTIKDIINVRNELKKIELPSRESLSPIENKILDTFRYNIGSYILKDIHANKKEEALDQINKIIQNFKDFNPRHIIASCFNLIDKELDAGNKVYYQPSNLKLRDTYYDFLIKKYAVKEVGRGVDKRFYIEKKGIS